MHSKITAWGVKAKEAESDISSSMDGGGSLYMDNFLEKIYLAHQGAANGGAEFELVQIFGKIRIYVCYKNNRT